MSQERIIKNTSLFVKQQLADAEGGHDWFHIERVYKNALLIAQQEPVDLFIVQLGALLHDIADSKFHDGDETVGPNMTREFLDSQHIEESAINHVINIIKHVSFKNETGQDFHSLELDVIKDADRLDAIGAIGIARTFNYGGFKNRAIYDPDIKSNPNQTKEEYKQSTAPTINHFYEKLLLLKDKMTTETGKRIAENRHNFMLAFLDQFYAEWDGEK